MICAYHFVIQFTIGVTSCIIIEKSPFFGGGGAYLVYIFLIELPNL